MKKNKKKIFFNIPYFSQHALENIKKLHNLNKYSENGYFSKKCEKWLENTIHCKEALLVNSCTSALEICSMLINIKPGDEIILPSYTFVTTANAFVSRGARPIFVDIDKKTLNLDTKQIEDKITKKTKAIIIVHYAGISCDIDEIIRIKKKYNVYLIEDAAQAILSKYKGKYLGSIGDLATLSFHDSKNIHCGTGGALLINNKKFHKRAHQIKNKGTNRHLFDKGEVKKYSWVDIGSAYSINEINAAYLCSQLKIAKKIISQRNSIWKLYHSEFKNLEFKKLIIRPVVPKYSKTNGHMYYILVQKKFRDRIIKFLEKRGIFALFHYLPLHNSFFFRKNFKNRINLENTELISKTIIRLPMHRDINIKKIKYIKKIIEKFFENKI